MRSQEAEAQRRSRAWLLVVLLLTSVVFGWTTAPSAEAGLPPVPAITLEKTVGLDSEVCATDDEITVGANTDVIYCYTVTNTGGATLNRQDLVDSELGVILTDFPFTLVPGGSAFITATALIDETTTNTATWTARDPQLQLQATATASATVNVVAPSITLDKTVGLDSEVCATDDEITVGPQTDVIYCYTVTNTGELTLTRHDLDDSELGVILTDFPFTLMPGASAFITASATIDETTTNTATWTARDPQLNEATATDSATVNVVAPSITLDKTVGTDPALCATDDEITVAAGTTAVYCYTVTNTSETTFTHHDLDDTELGTLLTDFPFTLLPGTSAFLTASAVVDETVTNTATWTASDPELQLSATATDSATVNVPAPGISLAKTVGTDSAACAATDSITIPAGGEATYCYTVTNTGNVPLTDHDLVDSELGDLLTDFPFDLAPGASTFVTETAIITTDTTNTATWTATDPELGYSATATDSATVEVVPPAIELVKTVGTDPSACALDTTLTVQEGTEVTYCYTVTNTAETTLNVHDLVDSELGDLLTDFDFVLAPGASTSVTASAVLDADTTNTATWTASDPELSLDASASADATVTVTPIPTTTTTAGPTTTLSPTTLAPSTTAPAGDVASAVAARGQGSNLPVTGSDAALLAWLGLALLVIGGVALGLSRLSRRSRLR